MDVSVRGGKRMKDQCKDCFIGNDCDYAKPSNEDCMNPRVNDVLENLA